MRRYSDGVEIVYMAVTPDKYELPLYVAESAREMGKKYNIASTAVKTSIANGRSGRNLGRKFVKVEMDENEE